MQSPTERLAALDEPARTLVLELLDELSRPLGRREIERELGRSGLSRRERRLLLPGLMYFDIIALVPREG